MKTCRPLLQSAASIWLIHKPDTMNGRITTQTEDLQSLKQNCFVKSNISFYNNCINVFYI